MKIHRLVALCALVTPVAAQSFNIDVGENLIIFPEPAMTYGGAANQPGAWNKSIHPYTTALVDLAGAPTSAMTASNEAGWFNYFPSTLVGDDRNLMIDVQSFGDSITSATATWTFSGLQDGVYSVYTYAWDPQNNGTMTLVSVPGSADLPQNVGGNWNGSPHVLGVTYALHHLVVVGGTLTVNATNSAGHAGSVNGFQLAFNGGLSTAFCFGDGTATACPCGNAGASGHGCANSVSAVGARLTAQGSASIAADTVVLNGTDMPTTASALYFQGTSQVAGGAGTVFGDGLRCAGGSVIRLATTTNVGGASHYPNAGNPSVSVKGNITAPGTRDYQVWYRNAGAFCTTATFNLSNGIEIAWGP